VQTLANRTGVMKPARVLAEVGRAFFNPFSLSLRVFLLPCLLRCLLDGCSHAQLACIPTCKYCRAGVCCTSVFVPILGDNVTPPTYPPSSSSSSHTRTSPNDTLFRRSLSHTCLIAHTLVYLRLGPSCVPIFRPGWWTRARARSRRCSRQQVATGLRPPTVLLHIHPYYNCRHALSTG